MDVVESKVELGENIVIIGGTAMGVSTAQFLAHKGGHNISIIGEQKKLGMDIDASYRWRYMKKLREGNVQQYTSAKVKKIKDEGVKIITAEGKQVIPADTVVIATMVSNDDLFFKLYDFCEEMYLIGDSASPRNQTQAIREGFLIGMRI
jgi:pyruvate/2-oxoglutarate dehydrogenase complex dihydrolipoamide dehydrogenase (E3) component